MAKINKKNKSKYSCSAAGNFNKKDLRRNINWYVGLLRYLNSYANLNEGSDKKALDIGCGIGAVSILLSKRGFRVSASDVSRFAVKKARALSPDINFFTHNIEKEEIKLPGRFDLITAFEVLEHLKKPDKGIKNMGKKLKKGGVLICSTPPFKKRYINLPGHISVKKDEEWVKIFKKIGFKNVLSKKVSFLPFLYRFTPFFSRVLPFSTGLRFLNSTVFIIGKK